MFLQKIPKPILWAGFVTGAIDLTAACIDVGVNNHKDPLWLLQNVASSIMGPIAFESGALSAGVGLLLHLAVAFTATTVFYLLSRRFPVLLRQAVISGLVYGAVVFLVMYRVVLPLTLELKAHYLTVFNHAWPKLRLSQFGIHLVCVGLPIALMIRAKSPAPKPATG